MLVKYSDVRCVDIHFIFRSYISRVELVGHPLILCLTLEKLPNCFLKQLHHEHPHQQCRRVQFLPILHICCCLSFILFLSLTYFYCWQYYRCLPFSSLFPPSSSFLPPQSSSPYCLCPRAVHKSMYVLWFISSHPPCRS